MGYVLMLPIEYLQLMVLQMRNMSTQFLPHNFILRNVLFIHNNGCYIKWRLNITFLVIIKSDDLVMMKVFLQYNL